MMEGSRHHIHQQLAALQFKAGQPVWVPPADFTTLLRDILTRFCGRSADDCVSIEAIFVRQKINKRHQLYKMDQMLMFYVFGLRVGEIIAFKEAAEWIKVEEELKLKDKPE